MTTIIESDLWVTILSYGLKIAARLDVCKPAQTNQVFHGIKRNGYNHEWRSHSHLYVGLMLDASA